MTSVNSDIYIGKESAAKTSKLTVRCCLYSLVECMYGRKEIAMGESEEASTSTSAVPVSTRPSTGTALDEDEVELESFHEILSVEY